MATDVDLLRIKIIADDEELEDYRRSLRGVRQDHEDLQDSADDTSDALEEMGSSLGKLATLLASLGLGVALDQFLDLADVATQIENKFLLVTDSTEALNAAFEGVKGIALETGQNFSSLADLYSKLASSSDELGISQEQLIGLSRSVATAIALSGAGAEQASAAILQFSQAMGAGKLAGDEFRSILENARGIVVALAEAMGITVGQLTELSKAQMLTSDLVAEAMLVMEDALAGRLAETVFTLGQQWENFQTVLVSTVRDVDDLTGASQLAGSALQFLADNVEAVVKGGLILSTLGLAAVITGIGKAALNAAKSLALMAMTNPIAALTLALVGAAAAATLYQDEIVKIQGVTTTVGNFVMAAWTVVTQRLTANWQAMAGGIQTIISKIPQGIMSMGNAIVADTQSWGGRWVNMFKAFANSIMAFFDTIVQGAIILGKGIFEAIKAGLTQAQVLFAALEVDIRRAMTDGDFGFDEVAKRLNTEFVSPIGDAFAEIPKMAQQNLQTDYLQALVFDPLVEMGQKSTFALSEAFNDLGGEILQEAKTLEQLGVEIEKAGEATQEAATLTGEYEERAAALQAKVKELTEGLGSKSEAAKTAGKSIKQAAKEIDEATVSIDNFNSQAEATDLAKIIPKGTIEEIKWQMNETFRRITEGTEEANKGTQKYVMNWESAAQQIATTMGGLFTEIISGSASVGDAVEKTVIGIGSSLSTAFSDMIAVNFLGQAEGGLYAQIGGQLAGGLIAGLGGQDGAAGVAGGAAAGGISGAMLGSSMGLPGILVGAGIGSILGGGSTIFGSGDPTDNEFTISFAGLDQVAETFGAIETAFGALVSTQTTDVGEGLGEFMKLIVELDQTMATFATSAEIDRIKEFNKTWESASTRMLEGGFEMSEALQMIGPRFEGIATRIADLAPWAERLGEAFASGSVDAIREVIEQITAFNAAMTSFGLKASEAEDLLMSAQRGTESLLETQTRLYNVMFSQEEQRAQLMEEAARSVGAFNKELGLIGSAAIDTEAELRAYVQSLDLTTKAGREAFEAAADLAEAIGMVESSMARYEDFIYTEEEKKIQQMEEAKEAVAAFNDSLGLTGEAAIDSMAELREYAKGLDITTAAGREAFKAVEDVAAAMELLDSEAAEAAAAQEALAAAYEDAFAPIIEAVNGNIFDEYARQVEEANRSVFESAIDAASATISLAASYDGSLASTQALASSVLSLEGAMLSAMAQIDAMAQSISDGFAGLQEDIQLSMMDSTEKQAYYLDQLQRAYEELQTATDPEDILRATENIQEYTRLLWNIMSPEDRERFADMFSGFLEETGRQAQEKMEAARDKLKEEYTKAMDAVTAGVQAAAQTISEAGNDMMSAAQAMQSAASTPINVNVRVSQSNSSGSQVAPPPGSSAGNLSYV